MAGVSGVAVGIATVGALLVYGGYTGKNPVAALRQISSGTPDPVSEKGTSAAQSSYQTGGPSGSAISGGTHPEIAEAALRRTTEVYSKTRRNQDGYSDCSSYVGKCLADAGITPPAPSVTGSYLVWGKLKTIRRSEVGAGDLLCGPLHIAIALNGSYAIGQQRPGVNIKIDTIDNIMYGQVGWVPRRYIGESGSGVLSV